MALKELFSTDIGLLSLFTIAFVVGMGVWLGRYVKQHIREDERAHGQGH